jgi:hypothetical protein
VDSVAVRRVAANAEHVVEQPDLPGSQLPVARQPALEEDPLRHAVPGDELNVALEHRVVERLPVPAADEVRSERLEDVLQWERTRPFPDGVADRDLTGERVAD